MATYKAQIKSEIGILIERLEILNKQVEDKKDMTSEIEELSNELENKKTLVNLVNEEISDVSNELQNKTNELEIIEKRIDSLINTEAEKKEDLEVLINKQDEVSSYISKLEEYIGVLKNKSDNLESELIKKKEGYKKEQQITEKEHNGLLKRIESEIYTKEKIFKTKSLELETLLDKIEEVKKIYLEEVAIYNGKKSEFSIIEENLKALIEREAIQVSKNKNLALEGHELVKKNKGIELLIEEGELKLQELNINL